MSHVTFQGVWSLSSAPLPRSSLQDTAVPLVNCLLGFPALSRVHGNQIPVPISHETTKVGFDITPGTGRSISALRQENAREVWDDSGVSLEEKQKDKAAQEKHAVFEGSSFSSPTPAVFNIFVLFCQETLPSLHTYQPEASNPSLSLLTWLFNHSTNSGWASVKCGHCLRYWS